MNLEKIGMYANWCEPLMDKIEEIAKEKYPNTPYWIDTGSRWNVCRAMLDRFEQDLKIRK